MNKQEKTEEFEVEVTNLPETNSARTPIARTGITFVNRNGRIWSTTTLVMSGNVSPMRRRNSDTPSI